MAPDESNQGGCMQDFNLSLLIYLIIIVIIIDMCTAQFVFHAWNDGWEEKKKKEDGDPFFFFSKLEALILALG